MDETGGMTMDYARYADLLVRYCLGVKRGETILINASTLAVPLVQDVYKSILARGAYPEVQLVFENQKKLFFDHAKPSVLDRVSAFSKLAYDQFDGILSIASPFNLKELADVDGAKIRRSQKANVKNKKRFMQRSAAGKLRWCLCVFPTHAVAQDCGMALDDYTQFVMEACFLDKKDPVKCWQDLGKYQQKLVNYLNKRQKFRITGDQTDIEFSTRDRIWINSDGKRNMPSGEVFTSPVETSVKGQVYFTYPTTYHGQDVQGVLLKVENGEIKSWKADVGQAALDEAFKIPGSRVFGEVAIGTNTRIQKATRNILFDEKIGGSIHMAVGSSYPETGGKNESALHWDLIKDMRQGGEIYADGVLMYQNGKIKPKILV